MSGISGTMYRRGENEVTIDVGDWLDYVVTVFKSGTYKVEFRIASESDSGKFSPRSGNNVLTTVTVPNTGGWQIGLPYHLKLT